MDDNLSVKVEDVDKSFRIHHDAHNSLKGIFTNPLSVFKSADEKYEVLKDISFEVKKGEFFGLVGKNGSGKSTLLKILAGIYNPDKGKVTINGRMVPFLELGVGFNYDLTAKENVFLNGTILGMSRNFLKNKFDEIIEFAEVERFIDTPLKNFSSGMQVRLAFSIAIMADADIYLLDEILAVGDSSFQRKCFDVFDKFKKQDKTIILVSHSQSLIQEFCDSAVLIDKGRIVEYGDAGQVVSTYNALSVAGDNSTFSLDNKEKLKDNNEIKREGHNRWGNFRLKLEKMFVDKDKLENYEGEISGKLKVKINDVKVRKEISDINLSLSLYNDKDALIALDKIILKEEFVEDEYIIIPFSIKIADLVQGFYRFSIRLSHYDDRLKIVYDHWDKDNTKFIRTNKREVPGILNTQSFFVNPEIVGIIRMRNEELILRDTLDSFSKIVDRIIIFDDASTDKSVEIARKHPAVIEVIQNKIWKKNRIQEETNHRDILLKAARKYNPNWIFYSDCDERFEGEIRSFLQSDGSKDVDGIKITLFDAYITPEDKKPYKDGSLYNFRKYFGPEKRDILMIWRNLDNVVYEGTDRREPILGDEANIITKFYCQHYGKALSEKHWDDTCEYYSKYFPEPYKSKWEARKGRAVHDKSDFGNKLYKWDEVKEEDIYNS